MTDLLRKLVTGALVACFASGCATGPQYKDIAASLPALKQSGGRVCFYRSNSVLGAGVQPAIKPNGDEVGESRPGGLFFVDGPAGRYVVSTSTETEKTLSLKLDSGETKYAKTSVGLGLLIGRIMPTLESEADAQKSLEGLHYTGK
ncbi:DUF2846 domain-containing protein [Burkholderia oklahomensis]|uniref:DUF2846 domain-containing protein n=1 Tax=Burkholderia oklahomensis TaxID=342113 RepID=A0AAI8FNY7_9BURK|nr:DUF2846 domain-containing protein [Burkholderia oklahomensis]AIO67370.1 hypothetical protein DM82_3287 [Burkholderia oklahomensis]AJX30347.1 hypothetical protein BG90_1480 [Burkholderia oklahomensis C6786]AOI44002.1 hypothetical protein WG70_31655 [Burkholderia oklahomensis EO147]AOI47555.1 hypothetical protein WI23_18195 [Burkholderia oklahomensis C6786]KUY55604.1 hypothetical protein WG70_12320 [Burkholderia oklahomensis EO147]